MLSDIYRTVTVLNNKTNLVQKAPVPLPDTYSGTSYLKFQMTLHKSAQIKSCYLSFFVVCINELDLNLTTI